MKHWYESKTIWFNIIAMVVAVLGLLNHEILSAFGIENTTRWLTIIGFITSVFNVWNRLQIRKPIRKRKTQNP